MDLDSEIKAQIQACLDAGDLQQIRDILDTLESSENPNIVKAEFTISQMKDLEYVRQTIRQPNIPAVLRMMVDGFVPAFRKGQMEARKAKVLG